MTNTIRIANIGLRIRVCIREYTFLSEAINFIRQCSKLVHTLTMLTGTNVINLIETNYWFYNFFINFIFENLFFEHLIYSNYDQDYFTNLISSFTKWKSLSDGRIVGSDGTTTLPALSISWHHGNNNLRKVHSNVASYFLFVFFQSNYSISAYHRFQTFSYSSPTPCPSLAAETGEPEAINMTRDLPNEAPRRRHLSIKTSNTNDYSNTLVNRLGRNIDNTFFIYIA